MRNLFFVLIIVSVPKFINGQVSGTNLDSLYEVGVTHYQNKEYNLAIESFSTVLKYQPSDLNSYFNRAASYYKIGDKKNACNDWGQGYLIGDKEASIKLEKYCDQITLDNNEIVIIKDSLLDQVAQYPGGDTALYTYIYKNVKWGPGDLPGINEKNVTKIGGDVIIRFIVLRDGTISNQQVIQSVSETIDPQVIKLFYTMPKWNPALVSGQAVGSRFILKIPFVMEFVPVKTRSSRRQKL